jgi:nitrous oxidase accessory protein
MKRIKPRFALFIILLSLLVPVLNFTPIPEVKGAEQVFFEDNFENYNVGAFPSSGGWELWYNGAGTEHQVIVDNVSVSPTKSLKLLGLDMWAAFAAKRFTSSSNVIGFEVAVRVEETNGQSRDNARVAFTKKVSSSISREYAPVTFQDKGTINSGGQVLQSYVADTWYKIRVIMNRDKETYSVWVDGELRGENLAVTTSSGDITDYPSYEIEAFSVSQCYNSVTAYFDDVKVFSSFELDPRLELVPNKGIAATTLVGSGFAPNSKISVTWDDISIPTVPSPLITDGYGNFTGIISVLNQTDGTYTVKAFDETGNGATATFTVILEIPSQTHVTVPDDYPTIQEAINHADERDTIVVKAGTYYENVMVNKTLTIKSSNGAENTIVCTADPETGKNVFEITADNVEIIGFTIKDSTNRTISGDPFDPSSYVDACGIYAGTCTGTKIVRNIVKNNFEGIVFADCSDILVSENQITGNIHEGIRIVYSSSVTLVENNIVGNHFPMQSTSTGLVVFHCSNSKVTENQIAANDNGAVVSNSQGITVSDNSITDNRFHGLNLVGGNGNKVFGNTMRNNTYGICPSGSTNTQIYENTLQENEYGIACYGSSNNFVYHNYFIDNSGQVSNFHGTETNSWDNGSEGNYWSDYNGTDADEDGIGDVPYVIDGNNQDNYPLMSPDSTNHSLSYKLVVDSVPSGVIFTADNTSCTAPWSETYANITAVNLTMPESYSYEGENYTWLRWSDGNTHRTRTVTVNENIALTALFAPENTSLAILVLSPENKTYSVTDVPLEYTVNRVFYSTTYSLDGQTYVHTENTTLSGLADGAHRLIVYANYTDSHMGEYTIVWFTVDTTPPNITDVSQAPVNINGTLEDGVKVNATVTDSVSGVERVSLNYTDGNGAWVIAEMANLEGDVWNGTIPAFPHSTNVTYVIIAEDKVGNTVTTEELYGQPDQYEVLPEFPLWIILPLFLVATASTIAVRKRIHIPAFAKIYNSLHKLLS